jgi:hypothetical protein
MKNPLHLIGELGYLIRRASPAAQAVVNEVGPVILVNTAVAATLDAGLDQLGQYGVPESPVFWTGMILANVGLLYPAMTVGVENVAREIVGKAQVSVLTPMHPNLKTGLVAGSLAALLAFGGDIVDNVGERVAHFGAGTQVVQYELPSEPVMVQPQPSPVVDYGNPDLEGLIQEYVDGLREIGKARSRGTEDYSIIVKDLNSGELIVDINSDRPQWAASEIKVFHAALVAIEAGNGNLAWTDYVPKIEQMLHYGSGQVSRANRRTNELLEAIGPERAAELLTAYGFQDTTLARIPVGGRTTLNYTSGRDMARLLEMIARDEIPHAADIRTIMAKGASDRLVQNTCIPVSSTFLNSHGGYVREVMDKTGYIYGANTNGGIIQATFSDGTGGEVDVEYVVNVMIQDKDARSSGFRRGTWGPAKSETIRSIHEAVWDHMVGVYSGLDYICSEHGGQHPQ